MRCCDGKSARTRANAREDDSDSERSGASTVSRDDAIDVERGREFGDVKIARGDAFEGVSSGSDVSGVEGGRRSAWRRAAGDDDGDGDASPTHSTFGRDSDRKRRARQTSRLVAKRLGGRTSDGSDSDEFASGYERARRGGDEERGFGFVSKTDIAKREEEKAREEELERKRAAKEAKEERRRQRQELRRERELESETASLLMASRGRRESGRTSRDRRSPP